MTPAAARFEVLALEGIPEVRPGDELADMILAAYTALGPENGDILVVTSKVVSKAEGRLMPGDDREAAIEQESVREVARVDWNGGSTRIVQNRQGLVLAAAGVDASNVDEGVVLLLPEDPDASALGIARAIRAATGKAVGVIVSDTLGRAWRVGQTDHAIGAAGVAVAEDLRGTSDDRGRVLEATIPAVGDELAAAADLVKGKAAGRPVAVIRGLGHLVRDLDAPGARTLQRPIEQDSFREGANEALRRGYLLALGDAGTLREPSSASSWRPGEELWPPERELAGIRLVIPVKPAVTAKSRLGDAFEPAEREAIARAIALDTIEAACRVETVVEVLVVTADAQVAAAVEALPFRPVSYSAKPLARIVPDSAAGLRAAIELGLAEAGEASWRAVLLGDLPALDPVELRHALLLGGTAARAFVPDLECTGTVLATAMPGMAFEVLFGPDSASRHREAGFVELPLPPRWGLRRDVDTVEQLRHLALAERLGPRTRALLGDWIARLIAQDPGAAAP